MADKTYKVNPDEEILIEVKKKTSISSNQFAQGAQPPKGSIAGRREDDYTPRRLMKSLINFYDLGEYKNDDGDWTQVDNVLTPGYQYDEIDPSLPIGYLPLELSNYQHLIDKIFEIDIDQWPDRYRKLSYEKAERYGIDLQIDGDYYPVGRDNSRNIVFTSDPITQGKWKEDKGLEYTKVGSDLTVLGFGTFNYFSTGNTTDFKITEEFDYSKPAVDFKPKGELQFFLVPRMMLGSGGTIVNLGGSPALLQFQTLLINYFALTRSFYLDESEFGDIMPLAGYKLGDLSGSQKIAIKSDLIAEPRNSAGLLTNTYGYNVTPHPDPPGWDMSTPSNFAADATFFLCGAGNAPYKAGFLLAVIKNAAKTYYVWTNSDGAFVPNANINISWP